MLSPIRAPRVAVVLAWTMSAGAIAAAEKSAPAPQSFPHAVVAADHPAASEAGAEVLHKGGNVVDAAVAVSFALSVVRPESCGIGGGGFMVIWNVEKQEAVALDYRERAPAAATSDMFTKADGGAVTGPPLSEKGGLAVAVPCEVAGLCYALEHYGTLDRRTVLAPAIRLARDGVAIDRPMRTSQQGALAAFALHSDYREQYPALLELYLNDGNAWPDDTFRSPLVEVLERIAADGPDGFYRGAVADAIVAEVARRGGIITHDDLARTAPIVRQPLRSRLDDCEVVTMPPPSSGGVALLETLQIIAAYESAHPESVLDNLGHSSAAYVHLVTEAMKHAFADRAEFLGDADFADVPVQRLIDPAYAATLAARIDSGKTFESAAYGRYVPPRDAGTSHFSIIDVAGNAVACTETINTGYGSHVVVPRYGIVLNNEMDDFAAVPGKPNAFGLIQSAANAVEPGKKPLSSMTPTILVRDGKAVYVAGASGGPRIISATLQVLLNMTRFEMSAEEAVAAPRFHHQWLPEELLLEDGLAAPIREELKRLGHHVVVRGSLAAAQAAARSDEGVTGGSDPRKGGKPAGY
jgi:gamma-glutamyltranspeptidase/glutathione hydrolase